MWQNFERTLAKNAVKVNIQIVVNGEKIEQIIKPSGHSSIICVRNEIREIHT